VLAPPYHRELLLPLPTEDAPNILPFVWSSTTPFWLEVHRETDGRVRYALGSSSGADLELLLAYLANSRPRLAAGSPLACPVYHRVERGVYARAVPLQRHHHLPIAINPDADLAGFLLRSLDSRPLRGHDVVLQIVFQRKEYWESGLFSPRFERVAQEQTRHLRTEMDARRNLAPYHVELRARVSGPQPGVALTSLSPWLEWWTTPGGVPWRSWAVVPRKREAEFLRDALAVHGLRRFGCPKGRRDVSALEVSHLLSVPWAERHPECSYAGAPTGRPGPGLVVRPAALVTAETRNDSRLTVGTSSSGRVGLPPKWNHLAILGRTQSGKSTLALNLVLQLLAQETPATVVVIEPTGTLIDGVVSRLAPETAGDTIEIDPAHATFEQDGTAMVRVPLSLLRQPESAEGSDTARQRWAETSASDLLSAIRSAWGEESIGGRAELVLRALVQGLSLTPGSNIVDAYQILSSKPALQRFVKSMRPGPLRGFFESHLPRLGYDFTMSSLDKVGKIATNPLLRVALCQRGHAVSFDRLLSHRLLLLNLSKAAVGADGANFLGAIYLTQLWAALQRTGRPDRPVYLVLDEVHNYAIPALAEMLSEGAKFGVHVVAVTQFLHRIPPRVREALTGNVDSWLLFSLGSEDIDDAWKIANGAAHGWRPQDFADGLRPHEVALAASGELVKLGTLASPPIDSFVAKRKEVVLASSSRYAQPEDSEASPWLVGQTEVGEALESLADGPRTEENLREATSLPPELLDAALRRIETEGDAIQDTGEGAFRLTARGEVHRRALRSRWSEGEEHVDLLTEFALFLEARGISMSIPRQVGGVQLPDGQFGWGDSTYNVEVECSTLAKAPGQVVRNVRKARAAGLRVLVVVADRSVVPRALAILDDAFPGMRLWPDGIGLVWKEARASFRPCRVPGTRVWSFLESDESPTTDPEDLDPMREIAEGQGTTPLTDTDPLFRAIRSIGTELVARGQKEATGAQIRDCLPEAERVGCSNRHIGSVLTMLGATSRRVWVNGTRPRVYNLTTLVPTVEPATPAPGPSEEWGRTDGTGPGRSGPEEVSEPSASVPNGEGGPRTDDRPGPTH
jgi:hypothetical protein